MPRQKGVMIGQFVGNATRALLMAEQKNYHNTKVLMEVDDNYLHPPPVTGAPSEWKRKLDRSQADEYSFQAHRKIVRWVDGVICATDELADRYERVTEAPIYVCPNSIDLEDWPHLSRNLIEFAEPERGRNIGYAGSASHRYDLGLVRWGLDWAWRQPNVTIWKIGANTVEWNFPHREIPWANSLAEYRRNLTRLDVGLCPLKRGEWEDCKSDIKCLEYLLSGVVPIVQNCPPYKEWIDILPWAVTEKDWNKRIKWAVKAPREELADVWERGYDYLLEHKLVDQHIHRWHEAVA